jgi:DHA3 family multidrug efflux protein-like MFS transporter
VVAVPTCIGGWFGTGPERGIAVVFTVAGLIGVAVTLLVLASRSYRALTVLPAADEEVVGSGDGPPDGGAPGGLLPTGA